MRRLALAGFTDDTGRLLRQWLSAPGWSVVKACALRKARLPTELQDAIPLPDEPADWLDGVDADVVLVSVDERGSMDDLLRRLAGTGVPMVLIHPACDSLMAHELQMLYSVHPAPLWVWYPQRRPEWEERLRASQRPEWVRACERIHWTAFCGETSPNVVKRRLTRAVHWCSAVAGHWATMQARSGGGEGIDWNRLSVTVESHSGVVLEWRAKPATDEAPDGSATVTFECGHHEISAQWLPGECEWQATSAEPETWPAPESFEQSTARLVARIEASLDGPVAGDDWTVVCQSLEVSDQVEYTIRRRRMVDLVQETPSEEAAFKGVMAAGSCALLLIVLGIFAFGALYESVVRERPKPGSRTASASSDDSRPARMRWWRFWPVAPLALYLMLQLLLLVARQGSRNPASDHAQRRRPARE